MQSLRACLAVGASLLVSCIANVAPTTSSSTAPDAGGSADTLLDQATLALATAYKTTFTEVNSNTYRSQVGAFDINNYVFGDVASYESIHPGTTSTVAPLTVGTVIVREVLATDGSVAKLTMIAKGPSGYDPTLGDWWFGETDPTGVPLVVDGVVQLGRLDGCHSCHVPRESDDYLFGVPLADIN